ncbi:MAG: hypothetical protein PUE95_02845 [Lachnospiraceae bacterium]|nr:hypothetical protein [Lachnospiraceae bacterium]
MSKLSNLFGQEVSRQASKVATDLVWAQQNGTGAYSLSGKIFIGCGVAWIVLSFIPIACKNLIGDYIWMWILAAIQIVPGIVLVILSKKSKRFQEWATRDFEKGLKKKKKLEEKIKIGKVTLPMTHGDASALKILGIITVILIVTLGIGYLQGWVKW